jgi:hypothetical protein
MSLWLPVSACGHPAASLFGEFDAPKLAVMCRGCGRAWNQHTVPGDVVEKLEELLVAGAFKPVGPQRLR